MAADWKRLLLVEGKSDAALFRALLESHSLGGYWCHSVEGKSRFGSALKLVKNNPTDLPFHFERLTHLVLVRDADRDPTAALQSMQMALKHNRIHAPNKALEWAATHENQLQVGLVVLPDAQTSGTLENLLLAAYPPGVLECLRSMLACLLEQAPQYFGGRKLETGLLQQENWTEGIEKHLAKLIGSLHFEDPDRVDYVSSFRVANLWPFDAQSFGPLVAFLAAAREAS